LLGEEKKRGMSLSEYELISTLWTEPIILKQGKTGKAFIRVPLSNLPRHC
jgi:hypothetical protein